MAVALLEKAIKLDPDSYELHYELGRAHRDGVGYDPEAAAAFERAAALGPDRLDAHSTSAASTWPAATPAAALFRFRTAALTSDYQAGDTRSAEVDFLLAHTLRELGYVRAALDRYELLIARLDGRRRAPRRRHRTAR
jgi:tetratricopeptide (TPR) repeat protein